MRIHIVQKGDTLWKIAQKYGVDFEQLKSMNSQLSNPDMIMPGMKIKVPTSSGTIKKETSHHHHSHQHHQHHHAQHHHHGKKEQPMKEQPIAHHPFHQQQPITVPVKKEVPIKPPKEIIKEVPKPIYMPKPPQQIIPEVDINNYYMVNMAKMNIEKEVPAPPPVQPYHIHIHHEESSESSESSESHEVQMPVQMPMPTPQPVPIQEECLPITPVLPGSGMPCPPGMEMMPMGVEGMPMQPMSMGTMPVQTVGMEQPVQYFDPTMQMAMQQPMYEQPITPVQTPVYTTGPMIEQSNVVVQQGIPGHMHGGQMQANPMPMHTAQMPMTQYAMNPGVHSVETDDWESTSDMAQFKPIQQMSMPNWYTHAGPMPETYVHGGQIMPYQTTSFPGTRAGGCGCGGGTSQFQMMPQGFQGVPYDPGMQMYSQYPVPSTYALGPYMGTMNPMHYAHPYQGFPYGMTHQPGMFVTDGGYYDNYARMDDESSEF